MCSVSSLQLACPLGRLSSLRLSRPFCHRLSTLNCQPLLRWPAYLQNISKALGAHFCKGYVKWPEHPKMSSKTGACTDIFLGGATSKFARGARENFIALHLDFIALHLEVERYTSRWSDIKFSRATKNITQHLNWGWARSIFFARCQYAG